MIRDIWEIWPTDEQNLQIRDDWLVLLLGFRSCMCAGMPPYLHDGLWEVWGRPSHLWREGRPHFVLSAARCSNLSITQPKWVSLSNLIEPPPPAVLEAGPGGEPSCLLQEPDSKLLHCVKAPEEGEGRMGARICCVVSPCPKSHKSKWSRVRLLQHICCFR